MGCIFTNKICKNIEKLPKILNYVCLNQSLIKSFDKNNNSNYTNHIEMRNSRFYACLDEFSN